MWTEIDVRKDRSIKAIVVAAFPGYRKHKAYVQVFGDRGKSINSYWDGGSRDEYAIVRLSDLARMPMPTVGHPYFEVKARGVGTGEDEYVTVDHVGNVTLKRLPAGFVLVQAGTFCGKASTAHVYANVADMPRLLPAGAEVA